MIAITLYPHTIPYPVGISGSLPSLLIFNIGDIPLPAGYERVKYPYNSFGSWLRKLPLKNDTKVYLYNGREKANQQAQFAVVDLPIGKKNLQQCADVCMRLRADYLLSSGRADEISFSDNAAKSYRYNDYRSRISFQLYLEKVFSWCGTTSLQKQLKTLNSYVNIQAGDIIINGGSPGHAVIIADVAINKSGRKIFLLAQGFMPAQDIHILKNNNDNLLNPWYTITTEDELKTPEWDFKPLVIKSWE